MSSIGHNGGPPDDARATTKMHYFQAEIVNFRDGIRTLKADQRGVYLSILLEIYDAMGPVQNDARRLSMATGLDARLINRVLPELEALGKVYIADGWVHNSRAEKEITDYVRNHARLSAVAKEREATKREKRASEVDELRKQLAAAISELKTTSASAKAYDTGDVSETSALALPQLSETSQRANGDDCEKLSKTNGDKADACQTPTTTRAREESRTKNLDIFTPLPPKGDVGDRAAINRAAAKTAFGQWQDAARRCGLPVPRDSSFTTWGRKIAARMYEHAEQPKGVSDLLAVWASALANVERSSFLRGQTSAGFRADIKFLCQAESFAKLIDGGYGNGAHAKSAGSVRSSADAIVGDLASAGVTLIGDGDELTPWLNRKGGSV